MRTIFPPNFGAPREPRRYVTAKQAADAIRAKGSFLLERGEDSLKRMKHRLREEHDLQVKSQVVEDGWLLSEYRPDPPKSKNKGRVVQAWVPQWAHPARAYPDTGDLINMLRRTPVFIAKRDDWIITELSRLNYSLEPYGNGVIVTLSK